jgi:hypothetical protein
MAEIYKDTVTPVKTKIFWNNEIVDADNDLVTARIYDITNDITISPSISPTTVISTSTADKVESDVGTYQVSLSRFYTSRNRKFKIIWSYNIGGLNGEHTTYLDVVTPYCSFAEVIDDLQIGSDPSDPKYKNYHDLSMAEKYARKVIEDFTGQNFYLYQEEEVIYGNGSDILPMPYKINQIHKLYADDFLLIDNLSSPQVNNWGYTPVISETGFGIRLDRTELIDNTVYVANGMIPPSINDLYTGQAFRKNVRYRVVGTFGWESVPDEVEQAAVQLIGQYFAKDRMWTDRYLKSVSTFDWDFEYSSDAFSGTGSAYVDKLLAPYVITNMVLI